MNATRKPPARLWVLFARDEPKGVIFRRGPSKQVLLLKWNTKTDKFETGQWFKARIYERRCDLSPNGELLIYFAAKQKPPMSSWTAISKPPYFTALALWPKGDSWNGGGWFLDDCKIRLNHDLLHRKLHPDFRPGPIKVAGYAELGGEDNTVWDIVRKRDGWRQIAEGETLDRGGAWGWDVNPPEQWRKLHPKRENFELDMSITGIGGQDVSWYQIEYRVLERNKVAFDIGLADWADWDHRGHLVFAKSGRLFRKSLARSAPESPVQIADFNALKFEEVTPPPKALRW